MFQEWNYMSTQTKQCSTKREMVMVSSNIIQQTVKSRSRSVTVNGSRQCVMDMCMKFHKRIGLRYLRNGAKYTK